MLVDLIKVVIKVTVIAKELTKGHSGWILYLIFLSKLLTSIYTAISIFVASITAPTVLVHCGTSLTMFNQIEIATKRLIKHN